MTRARIIAGLLSLVLGALLVWTIVRRDVDVRTQVVLSIGVALGVLYVALGRIPNWLISISGGSLTADDDPSNLSPKVYLSILVAVILIAVVALGLGIFLL